MQFALLGDHEDGLALARALTESGRHRLRYYSGPAVGAEYLRRWNLDVRSVPDVEEVLADAAVAAVIVAGPPSTRSAQLRRAVQSERHVLCVHPAADRPDTAYEAASIRRETGRVLLPILPEAYHPAFGQLAALIAADRSAEAQATGITDLAARGAAAGRTKPRLDGPEVLPPASPRLLELERWSTEALLLDAATPGHEPGFPGWDVLRVLAGDVVEVSAFGYYADVRPDEPVLLAGRFARGGLFRVTLLPNQPRALLRLAALLRDHRAELIFPEGWPGAARLSWVDEAGNVREQTWEAGDPWPRLVEAFEQAVARGQAERPQADKYFAPISGPREHLSWEDEIRCLELDDAARRSLERRRSSTLEFQEDVEEATFKGTMTLFGCALLWASIFLLILSRWVSWLGWLILPLFVVFLVLQVLRWVVPPPAPPNLTTPPE